MKQIVCYGEVLWDMLPTGKKLGGAPLNVALRMQSFGCSVKVISSLGKDASGNGIVEQMKMYNATTNHVQVSQKFATSEVLVTLNDTGSASYEIKMPCAWDDIQFLEKDVVAVKSADAFIYGSLVARQFTSMETLFSLLKFSKFKVFDVNLRAPHYELNTLLTLMKQADFIKFNDDEIFELSLAMSGKKLSLEDSIRFFSEETQTPSICVTLGADGAVLFQNNEFVYNKGYQVQVADTVGAGDSFLATLIYQLLIGANAVNALDYACAVGAIVASKKGANSIINDKEIQVIMNKQNQVTQEHKTETMFKPFTPSIAYPNAKKQAIEILNQMTIDEKISIIGGYNMFYTKGFEKFNIPAMYLSDATQGVNIRPELPNQLEKSVAFPSPIALTSTWNTELSNIYAKSIGEECRAGEIAILLGPGMNIYRISQNGRNFEYFGEDPYLTARMVENYVVGMQDTGTIATLKHFIANNTDYKRRTSNSVVDDRALREIYMPAFEAGVNAGAMAVMTAYNLVNGEYAGQSKDVITGLLREELGFKWLVMSDWWSVYDSEKVIKSGLDLDMPGEPRAEFPDYMNKDEFFLRSSAKSLLEDGKVEEADIDRMVTNILTTQIAMGLLERPVKDTSYLENFDNHIEVALQTARESMVLLKNNGVLPINKSADISILLTGEYSDKIPCGGGAAEVKGYDNVTMLAALKAVYGSKVTYLENPDNQSIKNADYVIYSAGTFDSEGWDKSFDFPESVNKEIKNIASLNKNTIVAISSGSGMNMTEWNDDIAGLIYSWYPGQIGFKAFAEIVAGITNPSGKLPITIEKTFKDSPGSDYIPEGKELYTGWDEDHRIIDPIIDVKYNEGIFVGYRWYEHKAIKPLYNFGFGLSYTNYEYSNLKIEHSSIKAGSSVSFKIDIKNTGNMDGQEIVQIYVRDIEASVERPLKELKDFKKVQLNAGTKKTVHFTLTERDFAFWDIKTENWVVEPGQFEILVGSASNTILAKGLLEIVK